MSIGGFLWNLNIMFFQDIYVSVSVETMNLELKRPDFMEDMFAGGRLA